MQLLPPAFQTRSLPNSLLPQPSNRPDRPPGDPYLRLQLADGIAAVVSMQQVQEVHTLPTHRLTSMPNMPRCVLGLMNRRSHVIWVVDLAQLLDVANLGVNHQHYHLVIIRIDNLVLALAVTVIHGFFWLPSEAIYSHQGQLPARLQSYIQGYASHEQEILLVLDSEAILHSVGTLQAQSSLPAPLPSIS